MSLINEALKRAQAQKAQANDTSGPHSLADLPEVSSSPSRSRGRRRSRVIVLIAAAVLAGGTAVAWQLAAVRHGAQTPRQAAAAAPRPPASPARASPADTPALAISPAASAEIQEIVSKSLAAIKYYRPPEVSGEPLLPDAAATDDVAGEPAEVLAAPPAAPADKTRPASPAGPAAAEVKTAPLAAGPAPAAQPAAPAPVPFDAAKYKVGGVLLDGEDSSAVVNGRIVRLGDSIDGAKVVKITSRNVQVEIAGKIFFLGT